MDNWDEIRAKRKCQLKRQAKIDKVKNWCFGVISVVFWISVAYTFLGGCIGTFFKSTNSQEDYEEYIQSKTP